MIKRTGLFLCGLAMFACGPVMAAAAADAFGPWITPTARAVIERSRAAYAALQGWTATVDSRQHVFLKGVETVRQRRRVEHFLNDGSPAGSYTFIDTFDGESRPKAVSVQNAGERFGLARGRAGNLIGSVELPPTPPWRWSGPDARTLLEAFLKDATYVGYFGQDRVDGQPCDVIQVLGSDTGSAATGQPAKLTGVALATFHIDPAGFIVRIVHRQDMFDAREDTAYEEFTETRICRYDAAAKLSADDFSRAAFEREARAVLDQGERLPVLQQKEFRPGERLPDMQFIGWADGKPFRLADLQGRVVVVETWTSWCYYCKQAFPYYEKMRRALEAQDVVFVAVSFDGKPAEYEKWMKAHGGDYGFMFGRVDAPDASAALKEFRGSLPAFYVLGRDGRIVSTYSGYGYGVDGEDPRLLEALRQAGVKLP